MSSDPKKPSRDTIAWPELSGVRIVEDPSLPPDRVYMLQESPRRHLSPRLPKPEWRQEHQQRPVPHDDQIDAIRFAFHGIDRGVEPRRLGEMLPVPECQLCETRADDVAWERRPDDDLVEQRIRCHGQYLVRAITGLAMRGGHRDGRNGALVEFARAPVFLHSHELSAVAEDRLLEISPPCDYPTTWKVRATEEGKESLCRVQLLERHMGPFPYVPARTLPRILRLDDLANWAGDVSAMFAELDGTPSCSSHAGYIYKRLLAARPPAVDRGMGTGEAASNCQTCGLSIYRHSVQAGTLGLVCP